MFHKPTHTNSYRSISQCFLQLAAVILARYWHIGILLKSIYQQVFESHAGGIWTKSYGLNYTKLSFLTKEKKNGHPFLTKLWRHFGRRFCSWNNCLMLTISLKTTLCQCSKNYGSPNRVTRLKCCSKHDRPDQGGGLQFQTDPIFRINVTSMYYISHIVALVTNFQNQWVIFIWLPCLPYKASDWLNTVSF